jgi:hypothetical protein
MIPASIAHKVWQLRRIRNNSGTGFILAIKDPQWIGVKTPLTVTTKLIFLTFQKIRHGLSEGGPTGKTAQ